MFQWVEFLALAQELVDNVAGATSAEATCRTAICRAYYAAFHHARDFLNTRVPIPRSDVTHQAVIMLFRTSSKDDWRHIADQLDRLHRSRKRSDYDAGAMSKPKRDADIALEMARDIIDSVNKL